MITRTSAIRVMTAAATAKPWSTPLIAAGRGAGLGAAPGWRGAAAGAGRGAAGAAAAEGGGAAPGAWLGAGGPPAGPAGALAAAAAAGAGILMVGAAVGLGGKLMRTVSFLGWTFAGSAGWGGGAPGGLFGVSSAIL